MRLERVHLADVPSAGPNENYRAARGHCGEYTRVLTATLCTVADGLDRLVPIVASATVPPRLAESNRSDDDDDVGRLEEYHDDLDDFGDDFGDLPDANAREPLHAAYRYLRNCLHPARHPDVVRERRRRSKRPRDFEGSPSLDAFVEALGRAGLSPEMIRARFGSDHVGHRYVDDWGGGLYDPLELHDVLDGGRRQTYEDHSDGYWALWGSVETETLDAIEHFDRCFYGYDVSEVPAPTAPPPLSELRVAPRAVDDLVSSLADDANENDASGVHVRVDLTRPDARPGYEARMFGWWPGDGKESVLTEIELMPSSSSWESSSWEPSSSSSWESSSSSTAGSRAGERRGVEEILSLCAAAKHGLPVYASDEVIDTLSVHPLGWKPSFATSPAGYDDEYGASYGAERRYRGFFYTPENDDDPADPRLFDVFLRFLRNQFGGGGGGKVLRIPSVPHGDTEGPSTARRRPFTSPNLANALLKGPAAFFAEIIKTWSTWTHRWHGFGDYGDVAAAPALSSQTGKFGTLARDAERRARRPPSSATRFALDGTIADQAALAVLLWRMRLLDAVVEDREAGSDPNLRLSRLTDAANDRHGGFDPRARSALAVMRREVALMTTEEVDEARGGLIEALNRTLRRIDGVSQPLSALSVDAAVDGGESPSTASLGLQLAAMDGRWEECARWRDVLGAMNAPCVDYTAVFGGETGDEGGGERG